MMDRVSVLIVDDEPLIARSLARYLQGAGLEASVCGDGFSAVELLRGRLYDVVIADVGLPDASCDVLLGHLSDEGFQGRVVLISGQDRPPERAQDEPFGTAAHFLKKPFDLDVLVELCEGVRGANGEGPMVQSQGFVGKEQ